MFSIVKLPRTKPVFTSWDCITTSLEETTVVTIKFVLKVLAPPLTDITAEPIILPTLILEISKEPVLEANNEESISGSLGSWLTLIVKSDKLSQSVLDKDTKTVGLKEIHATAPVLPPTQLPQLSKNAVPLRSPWQSK